MANTRRSKIEDDLRGETNRLTDFHILDHVQSLSSRPSTHGNVILLTSTGGDTIDRGWMAQDFVFRDQGGCRDLSNHEAGIETSFEGEKSR